MTYEEKVEHDLIVAGTSDYLVDASSTSSASWDRPPAIAGHESKMDHDTTMRSIELIGTKVIPP